VAELLLSLLGIWPEVDELSDEILDARVEPGISLLASQGEAVHFSKESLAATSLLQNDQTPVMEARIAACRPIS
jgi:hypothetical protein